MSAFAAVRPGWVEYGAEELKRAAHKHGFLALAISILIHVSVICAYYLSAMFVSEKPLSLGPRPPGTVVIYNPTPYLPGIVTPPSNPTIPGPHILDGIPTPVANEPKLAETTIPTQDERRDLVDPHGTDLPIGDGTATRPIILDEESPPDTFVPVEKSPVLVKAVLPVYPPLALKAEIEGRVYVKVWVDRQGKVRRVDVVKTSNEIFNEAAIDAAKQFVFTPAYMNNGPVSVWVGMPITFKLTGAR